MRREDATSSDAEALRDARSPGAEEDPSAPRLSEHAASPRPAFESSREQAAADAARRAAGQAVDVDLTPFGFKGMRLRTLVTLRWFAVGGQTAAVIISELALGVDLPLPACILAIGVSVWLNLIVTFSAERRQRLAERDAFLTLSFDLAQLSALLFLAGGLTNPFALFLLAPVTIAASVLSLRTTLMLAGLSIAAASILSQNYLPLAFKDGSVLDPPPLYLAGFWVAITLGVAFQAIYARRVSVEAFNMSAALSATQMALEREQRLSSIGALAAATAHELGTPLATIKLVAGELKRELSDRPELDADLAEDAALISEQAARCRRILQELSSVQSPDDAQIRTAPISAVVEEAAGPHRFRRADMIFRLNGAPFGEKTDAQPAIPRRPEIIHGLRNLIQNAVDFAASTVWIDVETGPRRIRIVIGDDGAGFSPDILSELGEPFATTRGKGGASRTDAYQGMGLGVFISKTLLERTGAALVFRNHPNVRRWPDPPGLSDPDEEIGPSGAIVEVSWPAGSFGARADGEG